MVTSWTRGAAELAKVVMVLCRYLRFLALSMVERQLRLKKIYSWEVICRRTAGEARWGEKVAMDLGRRAEEGFISGGSK